ncbi:MAG: filamentous hemagglutinin N-terminal domain-containing protein [Chakrabartia sp.]
MNLLTALPRRSVGALTLFLCSTAALSTAYAADLPQGGKLATGSPGQAKITTSPDLRTMTVSQTGAVVALDWTSFSIGASNLVDIRQSKATDLLINRVTGNVASQINGTLTARGNVFLINPNGISIGASGKVTASGFLASTLDLASSPGAAFDFGRAEAKPLAVDGKIVANGAMGYIVLMGGQVTLGKTASLNAANIALGAGESTSVTLPSAKSGMALSENHRLPGGEIAAAGGTVSISGAVYSKNGSVIIDGGGYASQVLIDGIVTASNSKVSINLDDPSRDLRIGNATDKRIGALNFTPNQPNNSLTIKGVTYKLLWTVDDVKSIANDMRGNYALAQNIDFKDESAFTNNVIVASATSPMFGGALNGLGHRLSNIRLSVSPDAQRVGLFAKVGVDIAPPYPPFASISNLGISNILIAPSGSNWGDVKIGAIAGEMFNANLNNNWVTGTIQAQIDSYRSTNIGGLIGYAGDGWNTLTNNYFSGKILGQSGAQSMASVGGIAGAVQGYLRSNKVSRTTLLGGAWMGGIAGRLWNADSTYDSFDGTIISWNTNIVDDIGYSAAVGGLFGETYWSRIAGGTAQGRIEARGASTVVGGLVGQDLGAAPDDSSYLGATIADSNFLSGTIRGGSRSHVGGIVGYLQALELVDFAPNYFALKNLSANAVISAGNDAVVGGIAGYTVIDNDAWLIAPEYTTYYGLLSSAGSIAAGKGSLIGGIFGRFRGTAHGLLSSMTLSTTGIANAVGGIAGVASGEISDAVFLGRINLARASQKGTMIGVLARYDSGDLNHSIYDKEAGGPAVGAVIDRVGFYDISGPMPISDAQLNTVAGLSDADIRVRATLLNYLSMAGDPPSFTYFTVADGTLPTLKTVR